MVNQIKSMGYLNLVVFLCLVFAIFGCANAPTKAVKNGEETVVEVIVKTSLGDMQVQLYPDKAPITVANFLRYVDAGAYQGGSFYRVVRHDNDKGSPKITVTQGGANEDFVQFAPIVLESTEQTGIEHLDGTLSMARLGPHSATTDFFICIGPQPALDFGGQRHSDGLGFAAFGRVVNGIEVARRINQIRAAKPTDDAYQVGQILRQAVVIEAIVRN